MSIPDSSRVSGLAAVLGGGLFVHMIVNEPPLEDNRFLWTLLPMVCLWAVALTSLFRRLAATSSLGNKAAFSLAMTALMLLVAGLFAFNFGDPDLPWYLLGIGFYGLAIGIVGMGIIALVYKKLGKWRLSPLILGSVFLGFMVTVSFPNSPEELALLLLILNGLGWLLLGISLWQSQEEAHEPGRLA